MALFLIIVAIYLLWAGSLTLGLKSYRSIILGSLAANVPLIGLMAPGDGGVWLGNVCVYLTMLLALLWLFRRELGSVTDSVTHQAFMIRGLIFLAPIGVAVAYTALAEW